MKITSAECNKLLSQLMDKKQKLIIDDGMLCAYHAAVGENPAELKPDYDFAKMQNEIDAVDAEIIRVKHHLNLFNSTTHINDNLTIDQALVKLPQLSAKRNRLRRMMNAIPRERGTINGSIIDYIYTSYDPKEAATMYDEVVEEINSIQLALDKVNNTATFEV